MKKKKNINVTKKNNEDKIVVADYSRTASLEFSEQAIKHQQRQSKIALNNMDIEAYIIHYVDKGYSGLNFNRPAFKRMLNAIKNDKIDAIVVSDFDRITRNIFDLDYFVTEILNPRKIKLFSASQNESYTTLKNKFIFGEMEEIYEAQYKSEQQIRRKMATKFQQEKKEKCKEEK